MESLKSIPGIGESSLELLEAAGFLDVESVARSDSEELVTELRRANAILNIAGETPSREMVSEWISTARDITGIQVEKKQPVTAEGPVDYEEAPDVAAMLDEAPFAIPLPARMLMARQLAVDDIPPAILLNSYSGEFDVRTGVHLPNARPAKIKPAALAFPNYVLLSSENGKRQEIDASRLRSTSDASVPAIRVPAVKTTPVNERVALLRAPRPETNKGRTPHSRWYIHGVLHSHPWSIIAGALVTLLLFIATPLALLSSLFLLLSGEMPQRFGWVPGWLIVIPMALPFFGLCYLVWGFGGSCRICGQGLFRSGRHLRNPKAHYVRGLGYIFPLCVQILLFRWFRCTHCGTPVRLKE